MGSVRPRPLSLAPPPPEAGQVIAGKYRIERRIGEGGMGTVLAARHELLDIPVAIKLLSAELVQQPGVVARFLREARAVARLKSEHVARVMDVGTVADGQPYIVMDLLEGEDLEQRLQQGPLPIAEAADCILQALEAMAHAHAIGIVHRDLKPANLFVTVRPDGREVVKVLDFGIAKLTEGAAKKEGSRSGMLTGEHSTLGSPSYMAPEQVRASPNIDQRADVWAIGAILYELVTGRVAFGGNSVGEIFGAVLHSTPTPACELRPDAPLALEWVIARCLKRSVEDRFANVAEVARAVAPFGSGAWSGHVSRIEQTLMRAGKSDLDPMRLSRPDGTSDASLPWTSEPSSHRRPKLGETLSAEDAAPSSTDRETFKAAETLPAPAMRTPPPVAQSASPRAGRSTSWLALGAALTVVLVVLATYALRKPDSGASTRPTAASSPAAPISIPAPAVENPIAIAPAVIAVEPPPPPPQPSATAPAPAPRSKVAPPPPARPAVAPARKPRASPSESLHVLDSPD